MGWLDGITNLMGLNFKQALGVGDGQCSLMCCSQWGLRDSEMTEPLNGESGGRERAQVITGVPMARSQGTWGSLPLGDWL